MSKSIRVDEDTHRALAALKGEDETFDEFDVFVGCEYRPRGGPA
jgi:hypothetical protein